MRISRWRTKNYPDIEFALAHVDIIPYCTFAAFVAMLEELNMGEVFVGTGEDSKRTITCRYETAGQTGGDIRPLLELLPQCFPQLDVDIAHKVKPRDVEDKPRYVHFDEMGTIVELMQVTHAEKRLLQEGVWRKAISRLLQSCTKPTSGTIAIK